jgi:hypothetical protein
MKDILHLTDNSKQDIHDTVNKLATEEKQISTFINATKNSDRYQVNLDEVDRIYPYTEFQLVESYMNIIFPQSEGYTVSGWLIFLF